MNNAIQNLGIPQSWPEDAAFVFVRTQDPYTSTGYRLHIAKASEGVVLGSFPSVSTAARSIQQFNRLEKQAA